MLFGLIKGHLADLGTIKSDSNTITDDGAGEEELGEQGLLDIGEGSAVGPFLGSVFLHPTGLDISAGNQQNCCFKLLLQLSHQLLIQRSQQDLMALMSKIDQSNRFFLAVRDFHNFVNLNECSISFIIAIKLSNYFLEGCTSLLLDCRVGGIFQGF